MKTIDRKTIKITNSIYRSGRVTIHKGIFPRVIGNY